MVYTSSRGNLKRALQLNTEVPATDAEELSIEYALEKWVFDCYNEHALIK